MNDKLVYTVYEVSSVLHSSPNYIYELIRKGYWGRSKWVKLISEKEVTSMNIELK